MEGNEIYNKKLNKALIKRALGYMSREVTEEFSSDNGKMKLIKKKITKKKVPPDITAVKVLLDIYGDQELDVSNMTDEELLLERDKLLEKLKEDKE